MADAFENILGQPYVRDFLRATVSSGAQATRICSAARRVEQNGGGVRVRAGHHAPKGAEGLRGGMCGACDACSRGFALQAPARCLSRSEGAAGYLVEQVRSIVADTSLAPIQAQRKV